MGLLYDGLTLENMKATWKQKPQSCFTLYYKRITCTTQSMHYHVIDPLDHKLTLTIKFPWVLGIGNCHF